MIGRNMGALERMGRSSFQPNSHHQQKSSGEVEREVGTCRLLGATGRFQSPNFIWISSRVFLASPSSMSVFSLKKTGFSAPCQCDNRVGGGVRKRK